MIARHENENRTDGLWAKIAAPLPAETVQWRQQGKAKARDGKFYAPFVAYIEANAVRERLDLVIPGEWDMTLESLKELTDESGKTIDAETRCAFKCRLQILGVIREDVGHGRDYKQAATDAFKRAAVRFGIGHELYTDYSVIYVQVDGDGKYAKAVEDPAEVWAKKQRRNGAGVKSAGQSSGRAEATHESSPARQQPAPASPATTKQLERLRFLGTDTDLPAVTVKAIDDALTSGLTHAKADEWIKKLETHIKNLKTQAANAGR